MENITYEQLSCINSLFNIDYLNKYEKFFKMFDKNSLKYKDLNYILNEELIEEFKNDLLKLEKAYELNDYIDNIIEYFKFNDFLDNAYIDSSIYNILIAKEKNESLKSNLRKFKIVSKDQKCKKVKYNFCNTITGRLTCKSENGNILTLPKKYRRIFKSKWGSEGELLSVDFKSLEPRLAKKITCKKEYDDIYQEINELIEENFDRSIIKKAVISTLYGSQKSIENISEIKSNILIETCNKFFEIEKLTLFASKIDEKLNTRINLFGRPIKNDDETKDNVILNNFIQSSAVDISLMYFLNLINNIDREQCRPLFIIHDAIIFDVKKEYIQKLENVVNKGYNDKLLGYFPLEITKFME